MYFYLQFWDKTSQLHQKAQATAELAKAAQNPIASLISLPLQNNTDFNFGPQDETLNTLNVQPVWPFEVSDGWNLITRTIVPIVSQPGLTPGRAVKPASGIRRSRHSCRRKTRASGPGVPVR